MTDPDALHIPVPPIALGVALAAQRIAPQRKKHARARGRLACAVGLASLGVLGVAAERFLAHRTTMDAATPAETSALITDGPYRASRNPLYVGMAGILTAHAIARGSWQAWLPVAGFVAFLDQGQIRREEAALADRFPEEYAAYTRRVPRWL